MTTRHLALLILGAWLGTILMMAWIATDNFASVDRALQASSKTVQTELDQVGEDRARALLRYHASQQNRGYFHRFGFAQLAMGVALAVTLLFATNGNFMVMALCGGMLLVQVAQQFAIVPHMIAIGGALDFIDPAEMTAERGVFQTYHRVFGSLEVLKLLLGLGLAVRLTLGRGRSSRRGGAREDLDLVDNPDHRAVDR